MKKAALILEGGALRNFFTSGVLDTFMEHNIYFPCVCGVSAGALGAVSYLSRQKGRTAELNLEFAPDKNYMGVHTLFKNKMVFNFDYLFGDINHNLMPLDYDAFNNAKEKLVVFTTDCNTGQSTAHIKGETEDIMLALRASASMPLMSPIVKIDSKECLDGGVSNPMPYEWAFENGYEKVVVILTRNKEYRKKPESHLISYLYNKKYADYPELLKKIHNIPNHYNQLAENIQKLESENKLFVIRPDKPVDVKRTEKDTDKLRALYKSGQKIAEESLDDMMRYIES